jgi:hypothetical protein
MADFASYDTTDSATGAEKPRVFGLKVISDIAILRRNGWGDTLTKTAGSTRLYDAGSGSMGMKIIKSDGTTETEALGGEYVLRAELDCAGISGIEMKYIKPKAVASGSLLAVASGNEGVLEWDSTLKLLAIGATTGGKRKYLAGFDIDGAEYVRVPLRLADVDVTAHGGINTDDATATQAVTTTPALLDLWENADSGYGISPNAPAGTLTVNQPGTYLVNFQASIESSVSNTTFQFHLRIDAVEQSHGCHRKVAVANDVGSCSFVGLVDADAGEALSVYVEADGSSNLKLVEGQFTAVRVGPMSTDNPAQPETSDNVGGLELDDGSDSIYFVTEQPIPFHYTGGHDVVLELFVRLGQAETGTDSIDMKATYESAVIGTGAFGGTTTVKTDTGATLGSGTAQGTLHRVRINLTYNDASNPMASDALIRGVLQRNGLTNVAAVTVIGGALLVPSHGAVAFQG